MICLFSKCTYVACPAGNEYLDCSWNLSCSNITGVRRCKEQTPCTSGCFCSDGTVLKDGVCSNASYCSGIGIWIAHGSIYYDYSTKIYEVNFNASYVYWIYSI